MDLKCKHFNWGPLLCSFKVPNNIISLLLKHSPREKTYRDALAATIKEEFTYPDHIFLKYLLLYFDAYTIMMNRLGYILKNKEKRKLKLNAAWINYMVAGDFNPPHIHSPGHFSCVLFLQIPEELKKENKEYIGTSHAGPGGIIFRYGENGIFNRTAYEFFPEVGDFYIFPSDLVHWVFPFKSKGKRISISANFRFDEK